MQPQPDGLLYRAKIPATAERVTSVPKATCLGHQFSVTIVRRSAFITSPSLVLNRNLRLILDAVLVVKRFLAFL